MNDAPEVSPEGMPPPPLPDAPAGGGASGCRAAFAGAVGFCAGFSTGGMGAIAGGTLFHSSNRAGLVVALVVTALAGVAGVMLAVRGPWKAFGIGLALGAAACGLLIAACWNFSLHF